MIEKEILDNLDNSTTQGYYCSFVHLDQPYSYLIDSRLNIFRSENGNQWAIAAERLGYNPRAGLILLEIFYFGNCLINLEHYNGQNTNYYSVTPIDTENFNQTTVGESLKKDATYWFIRGEKAPLSRVKQDYINAGIELREFALDEISIDEAAKLVVTNHGHLFRATDEELYKSIPSDLQKILVLDEWHHRDFDEIIQPQIDDNHLRATYEFNKNLSGDNGYMDFDSFAAMLRQSEERNKIHNQQQWHDNRPSSYETWQLIAKVITSGDTTHYKPTLAPSSHWKFYPDSGSL